MKKLLTSLASLIMVIALALSIAAGCGGNAGSGGNKNTAASVKDVYAASAVSGASYLNGAVKGGNASHTAAAQSFIIGFADNVAAPTERPAEFTRERVIEVKNGLMAFENAIAGKISETVALNDGTGEYAEYKFVMTVSAGDKVVAKMYYDETPVKENNNAEKPDDDEEKPDDDEEKAEKEEEIGEFETSTVLNGVIVYKDSTYTVTGKKETETDGDESEYSVELITMTDKNNYVEFSYEVEKEADENSVSYEFKIVKDGVTVQETELEFENEDGKTEISLKFKKGNKKDEGEFKIVKDDVNLNVYRVRYEVGNKKSYITVQKTETGYRYTYSNEFVEEIGFTETLTPPAAEAN